MSRRRIILLFWGLALVTVAAVGGWVAGSRIESPAEAAARTAPPTPSPILVPVEQRVLSSNVVTRGTARFGLPQPISIAPSGLKTGPGLITTLPVRNTQFQEGGVLLTASGRPVFLLRGKVPAYRDLVPGITGDDVRQLEQGLKRLGFDPGPLDGTYDKKTSAAVAEWYRSTGWEPFGPTVEQLAAIRKLEQDLGAARKSKLMAASAAAAAALAVESARATAEHADQAAAAEVDVKIAARDKAKADLANAAKAVAAARAAADHAIRVAAADLAATTADAKRLVPTSQNDVPLAVEAARAQAEHANTAADADVAAKIAERAVIVLDPRQTQTARAAADAQLELARAARYKTKLDGRLAVQAAQRQASMAAGQTELAKAALEAARLQGERDVQAALDAQKVAEREVELAETRVELAQAAAKTTKLDGQKAVQAALDAQKLADLEVALATQTADQLAADLEVAKRKANVQVPVDEIVFLPNLPVRVEEVTAVVGDPASGSVMAVTDNQLSIDSSLTLDAAPLVKPGMPVSIDEQALGIKASGVVQRIADSPGTRGVDGYHIYFEVRVDETNKPLKGFSVRLTIPIESTQGEVTVVPLSALSLAADGTSRVQVENDGRLRYVVVEPGLSADGFVEITPVEGTLEPGQLVVVGYENNKT